MVRDRGRVRNEPKVSHNEETLSKAYFGLAAAGITGQQAIDAINQLLNQGILLRERDEQPKATREIILADVRPGMSVCAINSADVVVSGVVDKVDPSSILIGRNGATVHLIRGGWTFYEVEKI